MDPYQPPQTLDPVPVTANGNSTLSFLRDVVTDSLRYWEKMRLIYNGVLGLGCMAFIALFGLPGGPAGIIAMLIMAVPANLFYCAVYPVDLVLQVSHFRDTWCRWRVLLFLAGLGFAGLLTLGVLISPGMQSLP